MLRAILIELSVGPTVLGRIPNYTKWIFPTQSMPILSMAANLGLILFLFLVGLEVDIRVLTRNWKTAASVSAAGMILPFGLGAALAYGLYNTFSVVDNKDSGISFGVYLLFIGVAMAITVCTRYAAFCCGKVSLLTSCFFRLFQFWLVFSPS